MYNLHLISIFVTTKLLGAATAHLAPASAAYACNHDDNYYRTGVLISAYRLLSAYYFITTLLSACDF